MTSEPPEHRFDPGAAERFRPRSVFMKTAVLVEPVESTTIGAVDRLLDHFVVCLPGRDLPTPPHIPPLIDESLGKRG